MLIPPSVRLAELPTPPPPRGNGLLSWLDPTGRRPAPWVLKAETRGPETYDLTGLKHPAADLEPIPPDHFLRWGDYQARRFVRAEVADVVWLRMSRAIAAPGFGLVDEFNVSGGESVPRYLLEQDATWTGRAWRVRERQMQVVPGLSVPFCHYGVGAFAHRVMDGLLQVYLWEDALRSGEARLVDWPHADGGVADALDSVGLPASARLTLSGPSARLERAGLSSALAAHGVYFPGSWSLPFWAWLRDRVLGEGWAPPTGAPPRRLYVRRTSRYVRRVLEPEPLERLAAERGFEIFTPEEHSFADQVRAFAEADTVLGAFGSGMTLTPLMRGRRLMIELFPSGVTDFCFVRQARVHGLSYLPVWQPSNAEGDFTPDLAPIAAALDRVGIG